MRYPITLTIIVVIGVVVLVGFLLFNQQRQIKEDGSQTVSTIDKSKTSFTSPQQPISSEAASLIQNPLPANATETEKADYYTRIRSYAVDTNVISIQAGCTLSPLFVRMQKGLEITITNKDSVPHVITLTTSETYKITPNESTTTKKSGLLKDAGIFGIGCDEKGPAGFFVIE